MNLIELLFFAMAIMCAVAAAIHLRHWGALASIVGAIAGLLTPWILSSLAVAVDEAMFGRTIAGRRRIAAEAAFDRTYGARRRSAWRPRPAAGTDGSVIVTVFHGDTRPPRRAFYRFVDDSMEPHELSGEEAAKYVDVPWMR